jgi:hypothetical protein
MVMYLDKLQFQNIPMEFVYRLVGILLARLNLYTIRFLLDKMTMMDLSTQMALVNQMVLAELVPYIFPT